MYCNVCGSELPEGTSVCPVCGNVVQVAPPQGMNVPNQGMGVPNQGMGVPNQGMGVPNQGMNVPSQGMNVPNQGMGVPNQGMNIPNQMIPSAELPTTRVTITGNTDVLSPDEFRTVRIDQTSGKKKEKKEKDDPYQVRVRPKHRVLKIVLLVLALMGVGVGAFYTVRYFINQKKAEFQAYYKQPSVQDCELTKLGRVYVKSQLILEGNEKSSYKKIKSLAEEKQGEIVGYNSPVSEYQIEFQGGKKEDDLESIIQEWKNNDMVARVDLHFPYKAEGGFSDFTKDVWWNDEDGEKPADFEVDWDIYNPRGNNWAVESVWAPAVWNPTAFDLGEFGEVKDTEYKTVNVGILDTAFDKKHKDLTNRFATDAELRGKTEAGDGTGSEQEESTETATEQPEEDVAEGYKPFIGPSEADMSEEELAEKKRLSHGTHVAGIIAANIGDEFGIAGIAQNSKLFTRSLSSGGQDGSSEKGTAMISDFVLKCELARLFHAGVRLINISMQIDPGDSDQAKERMEELNASMERFLNHYLEPDEDHAEDALDFLLVKSAGDTEEPKSDLSGQFLTGIQDEKVKEHILVVGGAQYNYDQYGALETGKEYVRTKTTNRGDRIDIYAPAVEVLSDIPGDRVEMREGTSAAAAFVTGGCALVMGAAPKLSATEVKQIICTNYLYQVEDTGKGYLNVFLAAEEAKRRADSKKESEETAATEGKSIMEMAGELRQKSEEKKEAITGILELQLNSSFAKGLKDLTKLKAAAACGDVSKKLKFNKKGKAKLSLDPGEWTVKLRCSGYEKKTVKVTVKAGETSAVDDISLTKIVGFAEMELAPVSVELAGDPSKIVVRATAEGEDEVTGSFDADGKARLELAPGSWKLEVSGDGFETKEFSMDIEKDNTTKEKFILGKTASFSDITFSSTKQGRDDGQLLNIDSEGNFRIEDRVLRTNYIGKFASIILIGQYESQLEYHVVVGEVSGNALFKKGDVLAVYRTESSPGDGGGESFEIRLEDPDRPDGYPIFYWGTGGR